MHAISNGSGAILVIWTIVCFAVSSNAASVNPKLLNSYGSKVHADQSINITRSHTGDIFYINGEYYNTNWRIDLGNLFLTKQTVAVSKQRTAEAKKV